MAIRSLQLHDDSCRAFKLVNGTLVTSSGAAALDYETHYSACTVTLTGHVAIEGLAPLTVMETFEVDVGDINEPCSVLVTVMPLVEGSSAGVVFGNLSVQDPDPGQVQFPSICVFPPAANRVAETQLPAGLGCFVRPIYVG